MSDKLAAIARTARRDRDVFSTEVSDVDGADPVESLAASKQSFEETEIRNRIDEAAQKLRETRDLHDLRKGYSGAIAWGTVAWLLGVMAVVLFAGFSVGGFKLSDTVIVTLITSTTVNVLGLFVIVAKWLFGNQKMSTDQAKPEKKKGE